MLDSSLIRIKRFARKTCALYRQTGSLAYVARYVARYVWTMGPVLWAHIRQIPKAKGIAKSITDFRAKANGENKPVLGIKIAGGLGDYIVLARFIRDFANASEDLSFDIYARNPDLAAWIFAGIEGFHGAFVDSLFDTMAPRYDLGLTLNHFVAVVPEPPDWKQFEVWPELMRLCQQIVQYRPQIETYIQHQPRLDNGLARMAVASNATRRDYLHLIAGIPYGGDRLPISTEAMGARTRLYQTGLPYVTVHNGFDRAFVVSGARATKCYPHFPEVVALLKQAFPDLLVVQLGAADTSESITMVDINLVGKTSLAETAAVLSKSLLHIDNEGGLVHLAKALGVPGCVVFGPTPSDYFGYPSNINIDPLFCGGCWWDEETWMDLCPRGFKEARCLTEQPPDAIARAALAYLAIALDSLEDDESDDLPLRAASCFPHKARPARKSSSR
jgi:hypothetical protein